MRVYLEHTINILVYCWNIPNELILIQLMKQIIYEFNCLGTVCPGSSDPFYNVS